MMSQYDDAPTPFALQPGVSFVYTDQRPPLVEKEVDFCSMTHQGQRQYQEDRSTTATMGDVAMCVVMDGHSSAQVSDYLQGAFGDFVLPNVASNSALFEDPAAFAKLIAQLYHIMDTTIDIRGLTGGSTAVAAFYDKKSRYLYLVNVGDSRAVAVDVSNQLWAATTDHKPGEESERKRIANLGGFVSLVYDVPRVQGSLSVSRSFGDFHLRPYVTAIPVVYGPYLVTGTTVVVLCSDGAFDVLTSEDVVRAVLNRFSSSYKTLCYEIVSKSLSKGSGDNITAVAMVVRK